MILKGKYADSVDRMMGEYYSELTVELDRRLGFDSDKVHKHYVLADDFFVEEKCLPIRIPGRTIGGIYLDEKGIITRVAINESLVGAVYSVDTNEWLERFVGERIERQNACGKAVNGGV